MLLVALAVIVSGAVGVVADRNTAWAERSAGWVLNAMLYVFVPFVGYVSFAHLHLSVGGAVGLVIAVIGLLLAALVAWLVGKRLGVPRATLGGIIICAMTVNTGYLGNPTVAALLGSHALPHSVAYDQVISGPMTFTVGFAVGAAFSPHRAADSAGSGTWLRRVVVFFTRNPPLIAVVAGALVPAYLAPHPLVTASHMVIDLLVVLGFFTVGVSLSAAARADGAPLLARPNKAVAVALATRFCISPTLLALVALAGLGIPGAYIMQAAMPVGVNSLLISYAYDLDRRLITTVIVWSTILVLIAGIIATLA